METIAENAASASIAVIPSFGRARQEQAPRAWRRPLRAGRLHVAGVNTGGNPIAVACAGFRPFAMMAREDDSFGYEMEIITHPASGIAAPGDLSGRQLAFTSETSNSGFKAPQALLESEFGLVANDAYTPAFSGAHDNSILGVANRDYDAAAVANSVLKRMIARDAVDEDKLVTIYKSATFPTTGYGVAHDLAPELQEKIQRRSSLSTGTAPRCRPSSRRRARPSSCRSPSRTTGR